MHAKQLLTEISIYPTVSEIRKSVNVEKELQYTIDSNHFRELVPDGTRVESEHVLCHTIARKPNGCKSRHDSGECEQDEEKCSYDVNFTFSQPVKTALLSSLITSVTWQPKYEITIKDGGPVLKCVAVIRNDSCTTYLAAKANLFGGYVNKPDDPVNDDNDSDAYQCEDCDNQNTASLNTLPNFKLAGACKFTLPGQLCLKPKGSHHVEFMTSKITVEQLATLDVKNVRTFDRPFKSVYALKPEKFLPRGIVCLRGEDSLIGGADLDDLPAGKTGEICLGIDPHARGKRKEIYREKEKNACTIDVQLTLYNDHDRQWTFRYKERYSKYDYSVIYDISSFASLVQKNDNGIEILVDIPPGGSELFRYTVKRERVH